MPIYEFRCGSCGHYFEVKRGFGDTSPATCPECQGESQKMFRPVPIIYKGSGFYATDHRPTGWKAEEPKEKTPAKTEDKAAKAEDKATKAEAKTEDKAEAKGK
ncbi:MAG: zinc ribbon domain-containing protein [Dehalococcoidia bacterium]